MSSQELLELTDKQKLDLLNTWNSRKDDPPSLLELIQDVAGFKGKDGRSKEGRRKLFSDNSNFEYIH